MGLNPATLWNMSLPEWRAALRGSVWRQQAVSGSAAMNAAELRQLMERFPDG